VGAFAGQSLVSLIVIVVITGCTITYGVWRGMAILANLRQPTVTREAKVLSKHVREEQGTGWDPAITYLITFLFDDDQQVEYSVSEDEYKHLIVGQCGQLSNRGAWYRGFHPFVAV
jgi:hypothetical protein